MASAPHVITRQRLALALGAAADGPALHRRAELTLLGPPLRAALDAALTQALAGAGLGPDAWLTLDRLALDLGDLRSETFEAQLLERLPELLRRHLAEALGAAAGHSAAHPERGPASGGIEPILPAVPAVHQVLAPVAAGAAWLFFLQFGSLPAHWPPPVTLADWEALLWPLLAAPTPVLLADLRAALARPAVRLRLLRQFSPALAAAVVVALAPSAAPHQGRLARVLAALLRPQASAPASLHLAAPTKPQLAAAGSANGSAAASGYATAAGEAFCLAVLTRAAGNGPPPDWATVLAAALGGGRSGAAPLVGAALWQAAEALAPGTVALPSPSFLGPASALGGPAGASAAPPSASPLAAGTANDLPADATWLGPSAADPLGRQAGQLSSPMAPRGRNARGNNGRPESGSPEAPAPDLAEYVTNAGVVLLHPFLPMCFEACGWLGADNQFVSPEAQAQAVLLVHFLATGRGQAPEYELCLPRLLCGVPPTAPAAPRRLVLGRAARAEGRALLRAALEHWSALRNTTPKGLRTAFLQREGKLEAGLPSGPVLTVAQQAQDVLLGRLPYGWGVGVVQLPWLPQRLSVSWA